MSEFKFQCPQCGQKIQLDERLSGKQLTCPSCQVLLRVPPVPGKTADYRPETGKTWDTFVPPASKTPPKK